jgi:hypothetical protein
VERGRYLSNSVSGCLFCHSEVDWQSPGFPVKPGTEGGGRSFADEGVPFLSSPNLTPDPETGAGTWSDDMLARAIREGISHDGRTLFPMMPYPQYKESGSRWLANVPSHWEVRNLRTLIRPRNDRNRSDLPLLSVAREKGVFVRSLTDADENHNAIPEDLSNYKVARTGSLIINPPASCGSATFRRTGMSCKSDGLSLS